MGCACRGFRAGFAPIWRRLRADARPRPSANGPGIEAMGASLVALLLLGGAGTRLWPLSTEERPKQFLRLFGDRSLFQMTVERARAAGCEIAIIANASQVERIDRDLAEIGI